MTQTGAFSLSKSFDVPPARLWHFLTDASEREAWAAPSEDHVLFVDAADVREGGADRHRCGPKDNPEFLVDTRWYRLDVPNLACFTETLIFGGEKASVSLVTYTLLATGSGCDLNIEVQISTLMPDIPISEHQDGWSSALERLGSHATA